VLTGKSGIDPSGTYLFFAGGGFLTLIYVLTNIPETSKYYTTLHYTTLHYSSELPLALPLLLTHFPPVFCVVAQDTNLSTRKIHTYITQPNSYHTILLPCHVCA
jgi:hypothetical protein